MTTESIGETPMDSGLGPSVSQVDFPRSISADRIPRVSSRSWSLHPPRQGADALGPGSISAAPGVAKSLEGGGAGTYLGSLPGLLQVVSQAIVIGNPQGAMVGLGY